MSTTYVGGPGNCYWGVLFLKGQRLDGSTGHFHFHYIIYDSRWRQAHATPLQKAHGVNGLTGQWVDGSTGQTGRRVTFTFTILYMIADDARLTPPRCKKHTAYDDTRLTPHRCKKHTASFARSTGKFPSTNKFRYSSCFLHALMKKLPWTASMVYSVYKCRYHRTLVLLWCKSMIVYYEASVRGSVLVFCYLLCCCCFYFQKSCSLITSSLVTQGHKIRYCLLI